MIYFFSGGAARFTTYLKGLKQKLAQKNESRPLVLFSGDFVGPSLMSSLTQGAHLIDAMNEIGVDYATFGNHELDYGNFYFYSSIFFKYHK